jgi:hypothetical protein
MLTWATAEGVQIFLQASVSVALEGMRSVPLSLTWRSRILVLIILILVTWLNTVVAALRDTGCIYGLISHILVLKALLYLPVVATSALVLASSCLYVALVLAVLLLLWAQLLFYCMFLQPFLTRSSVLECRETSLLWNSTNCIAVIFLIALRVRCPRRPRLFGFL